MRKHTLEEVKVIFAEGGCEFLDDNYVGANHTHNYRCSCGREAKITLCHFNNGHRCSGCYGNKKKTLDEVRVIFTEGGCEFLDDNYVNNNHPHNYRCSCGREAKICLNSFNTGNRCSNCGGNKKKTLEEVKVIFAKGGCEFIDDSYVNNHHRHNYRCSCGREAKICLSSFNRGQRCSDCGGSKKKTLEEVKAIFTEGGCEFLDDSYVNAKHRHNYRCSCGKIAKIGLSSFNSGQRCSGCAEYGFSNSKPSYFYLISRPNQYKVGIYNEGSERLVQHRRNGWRLLEQVGPLCGSVVSELESVVVRGIRDKGILMGSEAFVEEFDGWTESWQAVDLEVSSLSELFSYLSTEFKFNIF